MTISVHDFRTYIVRPTLEQCALLAAVPNHQFAEDLLVATAAQETRIGHWLHQSGGGDAISIYQFEPASLHDLLRNFVEPAKNQDGAPRYAALMNAVRVPGSNPDDEIMWNLRFATVCARLFYYRVREPLPASTSLSTLWHYYKTYWNTDLGAATEDSFVAALSAYTDLPTA